MAITYNFITFHKLKNCYTATEKSNPTALNMYGWNQHSRFNKLSKNYPTNTEKEKKVQVFQKPFSKATFAQLSTSAEQMKTSLYFYHNSL